MQKKRYRNAIRSKKMIRQAFLELLREQPFEKITVTAIVKKANVNRSTFYEHYPDIMGIIDEIEMDIVEYTEKSLLEIGFDDFWNNPKKYVEIVIKTLEENSELYFYLCKSNAAAKHLEQVKEMLIQRIVVIMKSHGKYIDCEDNNFLIRFIIGGMIEICSQWIYGRIDVSIDEIIGKITKMIVVVGKEFLLD